LLVLGGKALTVVEDLRTRGRDLPRPRGKTLKRLCGYLEKNHHRLERSGMHWVLPGAHAMVSLRSVYLSDGLWEAFTQFHLGHELRRLYPRVAANDELLISLQAA
jgi:hypothetical protein